MKKLIKDWWPLLLIAGWWVWKKTRRKPGLLYGNNKNGQITQDLPEKCPVCGSDVRFYEGGSISCKCSNPDCDYIVYFHPTGSLIVDNPFQGGECVYGSPIP